MVNVGFRIYSEVNRPPRALVERMGKLPVACIGDIQNRLYVMNPAIRPMSDAPIYGTAFTVLVPPGDNLMVHKALDMAQPGDVIVINAMGDVTHAILGELMGTYARSLGIAGFVVDGSVRDGDSFIQMKYPVFAKAFSASGPYKNGPGEINVPIACGGVVVFPGDIIVGDRDGVVVVPAGSAEEIATKAEKKEQQEAGYLADVDSYRSRRGWVDKALNGSGCEVIPTKF